MTSSIRSDRAFVRQGGRCVAANISIGVCRAGGGRRSPALPRTPSRVRKEWKEGVAPDLEVLASMLVAFRNRKGRLTQRYQIAARCTIAQRATFGSAIFTGHAVRTVNRTVAEIFTHTLAPGGVRPIRPRRAAMIVRALPVRSGRGDPNALASVAASSPIHEHPKQ